MPFQFSQTPALPADIRAVPRIDTHTLGLYSFLNPDALLNGYGITEQNGRGILADLIDEPIDYKALLDFTELTGRSDSINSLEYFNYRTNLLERSVKITTVSGTANYPVITLDADSYSTTGSINGPQDRSPLRVNDMIMTAPSLFSGIVISKTGTGTATQYTLQRRDSVSDDLLGELTSMQTAGTRLITYTTAFAEGSKGPDEGMFTSTIRLMNQMQTFRAKDTVTGDVDALRRAIPWQGKTFEIDVAELRQQWRHRLAVSRAMWLSPGGNITLQGVGPGSGRVRLTTGLIPAIKQVGATWGYDSSTGYAGADIEALDAVFKANYAGSSFTVFEGYQHGAAFYKGIKDLLGPNGLNGINFAAFGTKGDPKKKALDLGFQSVTTPGGITYHRQESNFFNEPQVTATPGYGFAGMGVFIPGGNENITVDQNGVPEKISVPSLQTLYTTGSDGKSRKLMSWRRGIDVTDIDQREVNSFSQQGIRVVNLHKFGLATAR